jgi:hypothetical protein
MSRLGSLLLGCVIGGASVYVSLKYHVLRTEKGFELVPKLSATFSETYYDVRGFGVSDWTEHKTLAAAVVQAGKQELFTDSASEGLRRGLEGVLQDLGINEGT